MPKGGILRKMIPYNELKEANRKYKRGDAYDLVLSSKGSPWGNLDSIIEFVRKWDKRAQIGRNKDEIKNVVLSLRGKKWGEKMVTGEKMGEKMVTATVFSSPN